ncbi:hypothetical protein GCM10027321_08390 [Massilia terrae]|uniref:Tyrosinase family protein n=1 Tax=Massilia terrae TaxID=1811224 RepID=A0ABT2D037_9BURK|nr:tyrosinase family protein [Massilia terrae]MCS0659587.1 tyrosinase family protein [Massilia terrae]
MSHFDKRRELLKGTLAAATIQCIPNLAFAQPSPRIRQEWQQFKKTSQYQSFLNAIATMRSVTNPNDQGSLQYWANVHQSFCPHGIAYFISWHRGYLYYFEQQLRLSSGDPTLNLPYWDYYSYATLPTEFTDPSPSNPLYRQRIGTNVYNALSLLPFAAGVYNFQRGTTNAFEPKLEAAPHNPVHDLIGGIMGTMQSPLDPIFFLHHANIDRLTHAWALPDGKGIPYTAYPYSPTNSNPYWAGNNVYASNLFIERYKTVDPTWLGYDYAVDKVPTVLPPLTVTAQAGPARLPASPRLPSNARPPFRNFAKAPGRQISASRRSLGGAAMVAFDENSTSVQFNLNRRDAAEVMAMLAARKDAIDSGNGQVAGSISLVFDHAMVSGLGAQGGYFYALYLNMPSRIDSENAQERSFVGTLGPFRVAAASHHGHAMVDFDISDLLLKQGLADLSGITLSWVRVDGDNPPAGETISADEMRIELSYQSQFITPQGPMGQPGWYR